MNAASLQAGEHIELRPHECHLWIANLDALAPFTESWRIGLLPPAQRVQADRRATAVLRRRFVASHALLRLVLAHYLDRDPAALSFAHGPAGKPELAEHGARTVAFNVSHSDERALIAVADVAIGVDIERCRHVSDMDALATRILSESERAQLAALPLEHRSAGFTTFWCLKEAFVKATGEGLSRPLDSFTVLFTLGDAPAPAFIQESQSVESAWSAVTLLPCPGFIAALVSSSLISDMRLLRID